MFNKTQIKNIGKFFWQLAVVMIQSGALAGVLLPKVPVMVVVMAIVTALMAAAIAFVADHFVDD